MNAATAATAPGAALAVRFVPVTPERHAGRWWRPEPSYDWAAGEVAVPVAGSEMARAALCMPLALVRVRERFLPVAVLGLQPGTNLFVAADGRWTAEYVPAFLRSRPFALVATQDGHKVLCVNEQAARISERQLAPDAQPFFGAGGQPAPKLQEFLDFLSALDASHALTASACAALQKHQLVVPWDTRPGLGEAPGEVRGLYRVDEAALLALPDAAFLELRHASALPLAYAQLLSTAQMTALRQRNAARLASRQPASVPVTAGGDLDLSFLVRDGTLRLS